MRRRPPVQLRWFAAPTARLVFDLNDFDETLPGPFEWDVKRLAASFEVAGRDRGFDDGERGAIAGPRRRSYREAMRDFAGDAEPRRLVRPAGRRRPAGGRGAGEAARAQALEKNVPRRAPGQPEGVRQADRGWSTARPGRRRPAAGGAAGGPAARAGARASSTRDARSSSRAYRRTLPGDRRHLLDGYRLVDVARKVVGVGSVGTRAWIVLLLGRDERDPLFLQAKEARRRCSSRTLGRSRTRNHGQRVVEGQRLMQAASDILLGWMRTTGIDGVDRDFYVRQLWDGKGSAVDRGDGADRADATPRLCGWTLARAHARSGDAVASRATSAAGTRFDRAIVEFAERTPTRTKRTTPLLLRAV